VTLRIPGSLGTGLLALAAIGITQWLSLLLWTPEPRISMVWLPGGVFLGALLVLPTRRWPALWIGALAGVALAIWPYGSLAARVLAAFGPFVLATLMAVALRRARGDRQPMQDFGLLTVFTVFAGFLAPMAGATWILWVMYGESMAGHAFAWLNIALAHSLGYVLVTPVMVGHVLVRRPRGLRYRWQAKGFGLLLLCVPCATWWFAVTPDYLAPLQMLAPTPFIIWALLRYGLVGACYAVLTVAMIAFGLSHAGRGPFVLGDAERTTIGLQLLFAWGSMSMLFLSVMAEQRRNDHAALDAAHRKLSLMAGSLIQAQEMERGRIARDLHDDINQSIAAVSIKLSMAKQLTSGDVRASLDELQDEVIAVSDDVRQLSHRLHPSLLRYTGLAPALRSLCHSHAARGHYSLEQRIDDSVALPPTPALALFRIAQEALGNVDAHARAHNVVVALGRSGDDAFLEVSDDGVGFADLDHHGPDIGLGLISMEERAKGIGATFEIASEPGSGTRLCVRVPATTDD